MGTNMGPTCHRVNLFLLNFSLLLLACAVTGKNMCVCVCHWVCRLASLEAGEKDSAEFTRWQEDMKQVLHNIM